MEYKILLIKNRYKKKPNFKTGLDWFADNTPLKITIDEITTDYDFTFKEVGNGTFKGTVPKDYAKLTEFVPRGKYHAVVLLLGNDIPGVRVSIAENTPLYPDTEFIYLVKDNDKGRTLNHELIHAFFHALSRKGIYLNDPMDTYLNDASLTAKVSNRTMALDLLKPYWERLVKPNSIIQNIMATITTKPKYKYFTDSEVIGLDKELINILDKGREISNTPYKITSGYRSPEKNKQVGGVPNSSHTKGLAVDLACTDNIKRTLILKGLYNCGSDLFIEICKSHIHVDIDKSIHSLGQTMWANDD
jgi:hypothetical protein